MTRSPRLLLVTLALGLCAPRCKVPLSDLDARFVVSDTAWFAEEETLFIFYEVQAQQGLGPETVVELRYTTDDGVVDWTPLQALTHVHPHVAVDCGSKARCGSGSLHVRREPRDVWLRLRYHREGELSLEQQPLLNVVDRGPAHSHRSLLVYGVFGEHNRALQWRARHHFPTIRNEEAQRLGLRRAFTIEQQRFGSGNLDAPQNPYAYGVSCPVGFSEVPAEALTTEERAAFNPADLPDAASSAALVCAESTVHDATGPFVATAVARKNPEVRPAFPVLRSPTRDATPIEYLLSVCERTISVDHRAMQRQRLLLGDIAPLCIDDWRSEDFADDLSAQLREDIERVRAEGRDMVLVLALHHDTPALGRTIEAVLAPILAAERGRSTPRVAGAFLLDSYAYTVADAEVGQSVLWCPAQIPDGDKEEEERGGPAFQAGPLPMGLPDAGAAADTADAGEDKEEGEGLASPASLVCALPGETAEGLSLGPFSLSALPILPSRSMYLDFIDDYSKAQAGEMKSLRFRVPELPPGALHVQVPPFGVATFFNDEIITADSDDAFSFCQSDEYEGFVFRSQWVDELMPVETLPDWHRLFKEETYTLGIVWDFPFALRLTYEAVVAAAVSAFSVSLPYGIGSEAESDYGSELWTSDEFSLAKTLAQCRRFCDHPTFDAAGVYQVGDPFREAYAAACFEPSFPERGDSGFPRDP